ncbi:MAG TPA: SLC13 family permease, partial [Balneolaceae bacterium]|nr:SLC13 family permease [Balneolaceae bacterium]
MVFWFTVGVLVLITVLLIMEVYDSSFILFGAMLLLLLGKVITPKEAFSGFSNQGMLAIGFLYVLAYAVQSTGVLNEIAQMLLGHPKDSDNKRLLRFLYPVAGASAFMNNTP